MGTYSLCQSYWTVPSQHGSDHRHYANERSCCVPIKLYLQRRVEGCSLLMCVLELEFIKWIKPCDTERLGSFVEVVLLRKSMLGKGLLWYFKPLWFETVRSQKRPLFLCPLKKKKIDCAPFSSWLPTLDTKVDHTPAVGCHCLLPPHDYSHLIPRLTTVQLTWTKPVLSFVRIYLTLNYSNLCEA